MKMLLNINDGYTLVKRTIAVANNTVRDSNSNNKN